MEFHQVTWIDNPGTKFEEEESVTVLRIPYNYTNGGYFLINAHQGESSRFEINTEEIDAMIEALQWAKAHAFARSEPVGEFLSAVRPGDGSPQNADDPHPVEEDG